MSSVVKELVSAPFVLVQLKRLALHYPRAKQLLALDVLAEDYAVDCRKMTQSEFLEAVADARAKCRYWPTSADILSAHEYIKEKKRVSKLRIKYLESPTEESSEISEEVYQRNLERVRELNLALAQGRKPEWIQ